MYGFGVILFQLLLSNFKRFSILCCNSAQTYFLWLWSATFVRITWVHEHYSSTFETYDLPLFFCAIAAPSLHEKHPFRTTLPWFWSFRHHYVIETLIGFGGASHVYAISIAILFEWDCNLADAVHEKVKKSCTQDHSKLHTSDCPQGDRQTGVMECVLDCSRVFFGDFSTFGNCIWENFPCVGYDFVFIGSWNFIFLGHVVQHCCECLFFCMAYITPFFNRRIVLFPQMWQSSGVFVHYIGFHCRSIRFYFLHQL